MKQVFNIGNSEELDTAASILLVEIGETHCCFGIVDQEAKTLQHLAYCISGENENENILQEVFNEYPLLRSSYHQIIIAYYMPETILIPSKYYRYEETQDMFRSIYDKGQNVVISDSLADWQLYNAYQVPAAIHQSVTQGFVNGQFWHVYSVILKNGITKEDSGNLIVDLKTDSFSVVASRGDSLLLAQIFSYATAEDVLYQLLKIIRQFSLSQVEVKMTLSGLIDRDSAVYTEIHQYFLNVKFASLENGLQLSEAFREYPAHFFSSIYKLASCVS